MPLKIRFRHISTVLLSHGGSRGGGVSESVFGDWNLTLYKIRDWDKEFENSRSRTVENLTWVAIPNRHDGENYTALITSRDAAEIFAAWVLTVQVASRCQPRGTLLKGDGRPHDSTSLSLKTRAPKIWFEKMLKFLTEHTDWLEITDVTDNRQPADTWASVNHQAGGEGGEGMEGDRRGGEGGASARRLAIGVLEISDAWEKAAENVKLPKVAVISDKRRRTIECRLREPFFVSNWRSALAKVCSSEFCKGQNQRGWVADFDWFILPDSVPKIIEGKYDKRPHQQNHAGSAHRITGADQRKIGIPAVNVGVNIGELLDRKADREATARNAVAAKPPET